MTINDTPATTAALPLAPGGWALDPAHSAVGFAIRHLGVSKVRGRFDEFTVDVVVGETLADTSVEAVIQVASVATGNADRDAHVLAPTCLTWPFARPWRSARRPSPATAPTGR